MHVVNNKDTKMIRLGYTLLALSWLLLGLYWSNINLFERNEFNIFLFIVITLLIFLVYTFPNKYPGEK